MIGYVLNGEHEELPHGELKALLELFNYNGKVERLKRYVITEESPAKDIVRRSGYIDEGHRIVFRYNLEERDINSVD